MNISTSLVQVLLLTQERNSTKTMSSGISFHTIVTNHNGPLQAVDCDIHRVRYDMVLKCCCGHPKLDLTVILRRCNDADTHKKSLIMTLYYHGQFNGPLQALDYHSHSVRYDMALESKAVGHLRCLIRLPTTLWRCLYSQKELEPCKRWLYAIMASYNGSLKVYTRL